MTTTYAPVLETQDEDIGEVSPAGTVLWRRLGLEALPDHETLLISTERLAVVGADHLMRSAKRLIKSIQHVGILQPPSVVVKAGVDLHDPEATFEVIAGRRRGDLLIKDFTPLGHSNWQTLLSTLKSLPTVSNGALWLQQEF